MTTTVLTRSKLIMAVAVAAMLMALVPATSAQAASPVTFAGAGTAVLNGGVGACGATGTFSGTVSGTHGGSAYVGASIIANFTYCNDTTIEGNATGSFVIQGGVAPATINRHHCNFTWQRIGTTARITISGGEGNCSGTAVAEFAPTTAPGAVPANAVVTGGGQFTTTQ